MARTRAMIRPLLTIGLLVLMAAPSAQAQSIDNHTGSFAEGSVVTLFGQGFGAREADDSSFFETWDWGAAESAVDTLNSPWSTIGADEDPARFSDEFTRGPASDMNLRLIFPDRVSGSSLNDMVYRQDVPVHAGDKVYVSNFFWSTYAGAREFGEGCPQQWKLWNWLTHGPYVLGAPATGLTWNAAGIDGPPDGDPYVWVAHRCEPGSAGTTGVHWAHQPPVRTWWQVEIEYQVASGQSAEDGYLRVWFNGELAGETSTASWCEEEQNDSVVQDGYVYNTAVLRNYIQWSQCDVRPDTVRHDDTVYQIGTWARVVMGDAPTWSNCTVREYQPVVSWTTNQVSVATNQGAFPDGATAWLYLVTDAGNRSNSYQITLEGEGGGGDGPPGAPTPPTFTQVIN